MASWSWAWPPAGPAPSVPTPPRPDGVVGTRVTEWLDAVEDPVDQHDLSEQEPDQVQRLLGLLEGMREVQSMAADGLAPEFDPDSIDHLIELGYAGEDED